jgi:YYY domain-containing protein
MKTGAPAVEAASAPIPPPRLDPAAEARPRAAASAGAALGLAAAALLALWWSVGRPSPAEVWGWAAFDIVVVLRWWIVAAALGLAASGWTRPLTAHLPDRGWALNRVAGLVGASYLAWLVGTLHLLPYDRTPAWLWVGLLAALGWAVARPAGRLVRRPAPGSVRIWLVSELVFAALLVAYAILQEHNPRTPLHFGDQGLDSGIVNAINRSQWFPPLDPWLAGWSLNYYYLGHLNQSLLARLTGSPGPVAYSLSMATVMALTTSIAFAAGWGLARRWWAGLVAAIAVGFAHNLDLIGLALKYGRTAGLDWTRSNHLLRETLTDPPYVTFLIGELHSQFVALPPLALSVALGAALVTARPEWSRGQRAATLLLLGVALGAPGLSSLYALPVAYGLWLAGALTCAVARREPRLAIDGVAATVLSGLLYLPFHLGYRANAQARVVLNGFPTDPTALLILFGIFLAPLAAWAASSAWPRPGAPARARRVRIGLEVVVAVALATALLSYKVPSLGLVLYLAAFLFCAVRLVDQMLAGAEAGTTLAWTAAVVSLGALVGIELITIDVPTTTVNMRFNIAWKTYLAVWIPLALAAAVAIGQLLEHRGSRAATALAGAAGLGSIVLTLLAAAAGGIFTFEHTNRLREKFGFDGLAYMRTASPGEQADLAAIGWLNAHARDGDVVLEVAGGAAHPYGRISSYTGLPTVLGWHHAVIAYQGPLPTLDERLRDVETIYVGRDSAETARLLAKYRVRYVVIGAFEEQSYKGLDRAALRRLGTVVFAQGPLEIVAVGGQEGAGGG